LTTKANHIMNHIDISLYICAIILVVFLFMNDDYFMKEGQTRDIYGNIYVDGNISWKSTFKEKIGYSGNPIYWILY